MLKVAVTTRATAKGSYQQAEIDYKDIAKGQNSNKKIMSFNDKNVFDTVANAKPGEFYDVEIEKGDKFWEWKAVNKGGPSQSAQAGSQAKTPASPRSTYETPEERAKRQVLIVRQSSLSAAATSLGAGPKIQLDPQDVIAFAKIYEAYVFGDEEADIQDNSFYESDEPQ